MRPSALRWLLLGPFAALLIGLAAALTFTGSRVVLWILLLAPVLLFGLLIFYHRSMGVLGHSELPDYLTSRSLHQATHELNTTFQALDAARRNYDWAIPEVEELTVIGTELAPFVLHSRRTGQWEVVARGHPKYLSVRIQAVAARLKKLRSGLVPRLAEGVQRERRDQVETLRALHARGLIPNPGMPTPEAPATSIEEILERIDGHQRLLELAAREALQAVEEGRAGPLQAGAWLDEVKGLLAEQRPKSAIERILRVAPTARPIARPPRRGL